jgi:hypothetical protein
MKKSEQIIKQMDTLQEDLKKLRSQLEEAEKERDYRAALTKVKRRIAELNEGWVPDWSNGSQKYSIFYTHARGCVSADWGCYVKYTNNGLYLKDRSLALQLIEEMPEELKLVLTH